MINTHTVFTLIVSVPDHVYVVSVSRYRSGIRGHMKAVVMDLLRQYLKVEVQFQHGEEHYTLLQETMGILGWYRGERKG